METEAEKLERIRKQHVEVMKRRQAAAKAAKEAAAAKKAEDAAWPATAEETAARAEPVVVVRTHADIAQDHLLAVWKTVYDGAKTYSNALARLEREVGRNRKVKIPSEWIQSRYKLPSGYTTTLEETATFFILKAYDSNADEVVHLTIPRDPASNDIHFTRPPASSHVYFAYDDFNRLRGGRKTRRRLPKQKRTRRVVRRLVRA